MTLETYEPARIDALSLRLLDVAVALRQISRLARDEGLDEVPLHDRKAQEWLARLEEWAHDADARVRRAALSRRAHDRAHGPRPADGPRSPDGQKARGKKSRRMSL